MSDTSGLAIAGRAHPSPSSGRALAWIVASLTAAIEVEAAHRRAFLWFPVAMGVGISLYYAADREPLLWLSACLASVGGLVGVLVRAHRVAFLGAVGTAALFGGMTSAGWRTAHVAAPIVDHIRIVTVEGYIEEMDLRREGARFVLRLSATDGLDADKMPFRVRLTTRRSPGFEAGAYVQMKARLLPPSRAAAPGGYDFARDAWYARIGAVGSVLGQIEPAVAPEPPDIWLAFGMNVDRARNALAQRVDAIVGGDAGAIAAAMVTGKRDLLSEDARALIREAGIFHVITIAGVQMTLVAGIFFVGLRRLLALSPALALRYPIKKWAAGAAILAAIGYDVMTGSRVGTERALIMTLIMLTAVLVDRSALTMRNLALAATVVLIIEPEALLGASFQLSFAAVGALIAVTEARATARGIAGRDMQVMPAQDTRRKFFGRRSHGLAATLLATFCATNATASFMAYDFHEVNPYVLIGNPLTLAIIEVFAVPGAILGTLLYPFGLDAFVWHYVGAGIAIIMAAARFIGGLPGATIHLPAFAPWSLAFFAGAVVSAIVWRSTILKLSALPLALIGLAGATAGPVFDVAVAPLGDAVAIRQADGQLAVIGHRPSVFAVEQWLRADADGRPAQQAVRKDACDKLGCTGTLVDGRKISLVLDRTAFAEDCLRRGLPACDDRRHAASFSDGLRGVAGGRSGELAANRSSCDQGRTRGTPVDQFGAKRRRGATLVAEADAALDVSAPARNAVDRRD